MHYTSVITNGILCIKSSFGMHRVFQIWCHMLIFDGSIDFLGSDIKWIRRLIQCNNKQTKNVSCNEIIDNLYKQAILSMKTTSIPFQCTFLQRDSFKASRVQKRYFCIDFILFPYLYCYQVFFGLNFPRKWTFCIFQKILDFIQSCQLSAFYLFDLSKVCLNVLD